MRARALAALALLTAGPAHGQSLAPLITLPAPILPGGALIFDDHPGRAFAAIRPEHLRESAELLTRLALAHCRAGSMDARALMRSADAHGWPPFVNVNASRDYEGVEVTAEGEASIQLRVDHGSSGMVSIHLSNTERSLADGRRLRARRCTVSQVGGDNALFSRVIASLVRGPASTDDATPGASGPYRSRVWWAETDGGGLTALATGGRRLDEDSALALVNPGRRLALVSDLDQGHLQTLSITLFNRL